MISYQKWNISVVFHQLNKILQVRIFSFFLHPMISWVLHHLLLNGLIAVNQFIDEILINHVDKTPFFPEFSCVFLLKTTNQLFFDFRIKKNLETKLENKILKFENHLFLILINPGKNGFQTFDKRVSNSEYVFWLAQGQVNTWLEWVIYADVYDFKNFLATFLDFIE